MGRNRKRGWLRNSLLKQIRKVGKDKELRSIQELTQQKKGKRG